MVNKLRNFLYIDDLISAIIICIKNIKQLEYNSNIDITSNDNLGIKISKFNKNGIN